MTWPELWGVLRPLTWLAWGLLACQVPLVAWLLVRARRDRTTPPAQWRGLAAGFARPARAFFWLFVLTVLLFWWDGAPWQGVEFYVRTFLPVWLLLRLWAGAFAWCAWRARPVGAVDNGGTGGRPAAQEAQ